MAFVGKNVVLSGGCGGIGSEIAKQLLLQGVNNVALFDVCDSRNVVEDLSSQFIGKRISFQEVDVRNRSEVKSAFEKVFTDFGGVDIVINAAGIIDEQNPDNTIAVNLFGVMNMTYAAVEYMAVENGGKGGIIVNVASVCGLDYIFNVPAYNASKHGVIGFTRTLADKIYANKYGIKFIAICPGLTETTLIQDLRDRLYKPELESETQDLIRGLGTQSSEECAALIADALKKSENGTIWLINCNQLKEIHLQNHWLH